MLALSHVSRTRLLGLKTGSGINYTPAAVKPSRARAKSAKPQLSLLPPKSDQASDWRSLECRAHWATPPPSLPIQSEGPQPIREPPGLGATARLRPPSREGFYIRGFRRKDERLRRERFWVRPTQPAAKGSGRCSLSCSASQLPSLLSRGRYRDVVASSHWRTYPLLLSYSESYYIMPIIWRGGSGCQACSTLQGTKRTCRGLEVTASW